MSLYVFSKQAEQDLKDIYRYGFRNHGENQAELYMSAIKEKCQLLSESPNICRERNEITPPVRICHHKKHIIVYVFVTDYILIIRVLHERMDPELHLDLTIL